MKRLLLPAVALAALCSITLIESDAFARAGGGRSFGSRGSRSYSPSPYASPVRPQAAPARPAYQPSPMQQPQSGGFLRSLGGGILGGFLGGMLFRSLGFGGYGAGGGGIGLFEIILIAGIGFMLFRFISRRRAQPAAAYREGAPAQEPFPGTYAYPAEEPQRDDREQGIAHIRSMDASFTPEGFAETASDIFFRIQGSWMNRDLAPVQEVLTPEMRDILQGQVDELKRVGMVNHLENVAVRGVNVSEAWQENGQDWVTVVFRASLLDYTTDEKTGEVLSGSKTGPVPFSEEWTFVRRIGSSEWKLSSIRQV